LGQRAGRHVLGDLVHPFGERVAGAARRLPAAGDITVCQVRRPNSSASVPAMTSVTAGPMVSGSKYCSN
jgi:hypothetical protein